MIGLARKDGKSFTPKDWDNLYDYIFNIMDLYSDGIDSNVIINRKINPAAYNRYLQLCNK